MRGEPWRTPCAGRYGGWTLARPSEGAPPAQRRCAKGLQRGARGYGLRPRRRRAVAGSQRRRQATATAATATATATAAAAPLMVGDDPDNPLDDAMLEMAMNHAVPNTSSHSAQPEMAHGHLVDSNGVVPYAYDVVATNQANQASVPIARRATFTKAGRRGRGGAKRAWCKESVVKRRARVERGARRAWCERRGAQARGVRPLGKAGRRGRRRAWCKASGVRGERGAPMEETKKRRGRRGRAAATPLAPRWSI